MRYSSIKNNVSNEITLKVNGFKMGSKLDLLRIPKVGTRFVLDKCIGKGVNGEVYEAFDTQSADQKVAIKIRHISGDSLKSIEEEFETFSKFSSHDNLPQFYGIFRQDDTVWFVFELCSGGSIKDLVTSLINHNRRLTEDHIAFILREIVKALVHLHQHHVIHRDLKANNIVVTNNGDIKLIGFSVSKNLKSTMAQSSTNIGSPNWMAPEIIKSNDFDQYGNRVDVWSLGITAIELAEGKSPFCGMHPTRILFQIVRNPPPKLTKPDVWSASFIDFITECLEKNPNHRPFMIEIAEHPFLTSVPENSYHLNLEIKQLMIDFVKNDDENYTKLEQLVINGNRLKTNEYKGSSSRPKRMYFEDLASMRNVGEKHILEELYNRFKEGFYQTFIGDILLVLNPNEAQNIYGGKYHSKYNLKSRSDNAPHIYSVASSAFRDAIHHEEPQFIILTGESRSGKSANLLHLIDHFLYLGNATKAKNYTMKTALVILQSITHAKTPMNTYSTRCILHTKLSFSKSGNFSGYHFVVSHLEKTRISNTEYCLGNFHIFSYFYEGMKSFENLEKYCLTSNETYRLLRPNGLSSDENRRKFEELHAHLEELDVEFEDMETIYQTFAAILLIGNIQFEENDNRILEIRNKQICEKVANLLAIDDSKFRKSLVSYSMMHKGKIELFRNSFQKATSLRNAIANNLYLRLTNWIVHLLNRKATFGKMIYGEKYYVTIFDMFGFESNKRNGLEQLLINSFNEQQQYLYNQRIFSWEEYEKADEQIPLSRIAFFDNKSILDSLLCHPCGVFSIIDDVSKSVIRNSHIIDNIKDLISKDSEPAINVKDYDKFVVCHYTGKVTYDISEMCETNRDYLSKEVIEICQNSKNKVISMLFANLLDRNGNLRFHNDTTPQHNSKWLTALKNEYAESDDRKIQLTTTEQNYSQLTRHRTIINVYKSTCIDYLKTLSVSNGLNGVHFVRCIRTDLKMKSKNEFNFELVRQQLKAFQIVETIQARQKGFPYRIPFNDFLNRYKFLAFDFDENVDVNQDNCRLLLVRLKMEGWLIGKSKVFLKYYNEEYLCRMYETHVKKVVKIQSIMRSFLAKKAIKNRLKHEMGSKDGDAALINNKDYVSRSLKRNQSVQSTGYSKRSSNLVRKYAKKWKSKTIFQVLLQYRAFRYQELINFSQQVHIFNQIVVHTLQRIDSVALNQIEENVQNFSWVTNDKISIWKMPFRLDEIPFFNTSYLSDPMMKSDVVDVKESEIWDLPLRWKQSIASQVAKALLEVYPIEDIDDKGKRCSKIAYIKIPFIRDENEMDDNIEIVSPLTPVENTKINNDDQPNQIASKKNSTVIEELEALSKLRTVSEDDTDNSLEFDYRRILRKTSYQRNSMRRSNEFSDLVNNRKCSFDNDNDNSIRQIQLAPGVLMEGVVIDL